MTCHCERIAEIGGVLRRAHRLRWPDPDSCAMQRNPSTVSWIGDCRRRQTILVCSSIRGTDRPRSRQRKARRPSVVAGSVAAAAAGADCVGTTLYGYTEPTGGALCFSWPLLANMTRDLKVPIMAEGHISSPEEARRAVDEGLRIVHHRNWKLKASLRKSAQLKSSPSRKIVRRRKNAAIAIVDCARSCDANPGWLDSLAARDMQNIRDRPDQAGDDSVAALTCRGGRLRGIADFANGPYQPGLDRGPADIHANQAMPAMMRRLLLGSINWRAPAMPLPNVPMPAWQNPWAKESPTSSIFSIHRQYSFRRFD